MKRRNHWVLFAILLLGLISLSPSDNRLLINKEDTVITESEPEPFPDEEKAPGRLEIVVNMESDEFAKLQELSDQFAQNTGASIELVNKSSEDAYKVFERMLALHNAPDILMVDDHWIRSFAQQGYLLPTDSYYAGAAVSSLSGLQAFSEWNGYLWAVPKDLDPYVLVYNPVILSGLGFETPPVTLDNWSRLFFAYLQTNAQQNSPVLLAGHFEDPLAFLSLVRRMGGGALKEEGLSKLELSTGEKAALLLLEKARPYMLSSSAASPEALWDKLASGEVAAAVVRYSEARRHPSSILRTELPSSLPASLMMTGEGRSLAVSSSAADPKLANEWITAVTEVNEQKLWYETTGKLPAARSLYDTSESMEIAAFLPADSSAKGLVWSLPAVSSLPDLLSQIAGLNSSFVNGMISRDTFIEQYAALLNKQARP